MPNRILRAELLESEGWLALKDNADRAAYIACVLTVDTLGNMPAGPHRLVKLWRPYGIDTPEKAAKVCADLSDVDLIRVYESDRKRYIHIPRFQQSRRFLGHLWPLSPWATDDEKQSFAKKSQVIHKSSPVKLRESPIGVGVGVGVGVEPKTIVGLTPDPIPNSNGKAHQTRAFNATAVSIIAFLNEKTGSHYQPVQANVKMIVGRLQEGFTEKQIRQVIANRCLEWQGDEKMDEYLRPKTLFNATNFASYAGLLGKTTVEG